jgi:hypothetical protein
MEKSQAVRASAALMSEATVSPCPIRGRVQSATAPMSTICPCRIRVRSVTAPCQSSGQPAGRAQQHCGATQQGKPGCPGETGHALGCPAVAPARLAGHRRQVSASPVDGGAPPPPMEFLFPKPGPGTGPAPFCRGLSALRKASRNSGVLPDLPGASGHCSCRRWPARPAPVVSHAHPRRWSSFSNPGGPRAGWRPLAPPSCA